MLCAIPLSLVHARPSPFYYLFNDIMNLDFLDLFNGELKPYYFCIHHNMPPEELTSTFLKNLPMKLAQFPMA